MLGISDAAESIGFRTMGVRLSLEQLRKDMPLPCILHWKQRHFVVCYDIRKKRDGYRYYIADPALQRVTYTDAEMERAWLSTKKDGEERGAALALEPTPEFYTLTDEAKQNGGRNGLGFFFRYLSPYRRELIQLVLGMVVGTLFSLVNFFVFAAILGYYNGGILLLFLLGNTLYIAWVLVFMKYRRELDINPHVWRAKTGAVMQDGFIFSDTIANNIAVSTDTVVGCCWALCCCCWQEVRGSAIRKRW